MRSRNIPLAARNLALLLWNQLRKASRRSTQQSRRGMKHAREAAKHARAQVKAGRERVRDEALTAYGGTVRGGRAWTRLYQRAWGQITLEQSVRRELRAAARGSAPIVVGPWLSEVGYEALYWVPFVRWFAGHYRIEPERLIVVSRGGTGSWYRDVASGYVELLDLFSPQEFAARNDERKAHGDQKQLGLGTFDAETLDRVRRAVGRDDLNVCHPSAMFRLLRQFWLGNESLQHVLDHTRFVPLQGDPGLALPGLPSRFAAVKFYSGHSLPDTPATRERLRALLLRLADEMPLVVLNTALTLDEHQDYLIGGIPGVMALDAWLTPQNNLAVQTEVIRRAERFVGTCGSLAWLAPMLGTPTLAVYSDAAFLTPHLYAAPHIYAGMAAAPFTPVDLRAIEALAGAAPLAARPS